MAIGPKGVAYQAPELREYGIDITPFDCPRDNIGKGFLHPESQGPCAPPTAPLRFPLHSQQPGSSDSLLLMAADPTPPAANNWRLQRRIYWQSLYLLIAT